MRQTCAALILFFGMAFPATAQEEREDGPSLMERGAQQFLEGLLQEMEPAWRELQDFMDQMGPTMLELMDQIEDWSVYEPPEVLENGDIIIRRKPREEEAPPREEYRQEKEALPPVEL